MPIFLGEDPPPVEPSNADRVVCLRYHPVTPIAPSTCATCRDIPALFYLRYITALSFVSVFVRKNRTGRLKTGKNAANDFASFGCVFAGVISGHIGFAGLYGKPYSNGADMAKECHQLCWGAHTPDLNALGCFCLNPKKLSTQVACAKSMPLIKMSRDRLIHELSNGVDRLYDAYSTDPVGVDNVGIYAADPASVIVDTVIANRKSLVGGGVPLGAVEVVTIPATSTAPEITVAVVRHLKHQALVTATGRFSFIYSRSGYLYSVAMEVDSRDD